MEHRMRITSENAVIEIAEKYGMDDLEIIRLKYESKPLKPVVFKIYDTEFTCYCYNLKDGGITHRWYMHKIKPSIMTRLHQYLFNLFN